MGGGDGEGDADHKIDTHEDLEQGHGELHGGQDAAPASTPGSVGVGGVELWGADEGGIVADETFDRGAGVVEADADADAHEDGDLEDGGGGAAFALAL